MTEQSRRENGSGRRAGMGRKAFRTGLLFILLLMMLGTSGCQRIRYTQEQAKAQAEIGEKLIRTYLDSRYPEYTLKSAEMLCGPQPGDPIFGPVFASGMVQGRYTVSEKEYIIAVNNESGAVYTSENMSLLAPVLSENITEFLKDTGIGPVRATSCSLELTAIFHDVPTVHNSGRNVSVEVSVNDVLPVSVTEDTVRDFVNGGFGELKCTALNLYFHSDEKNTFPWQALGELVGNGSFDYGYIMIYNTSAEALESGKGLQDAATEFWHVSVLDEGESVSLSLYKDYEAAASTEDAVSTAPETTVQEKPGPDCRLHIRYKNAGVLVRYPHYRDSDGVVTMQFNGTDWYTVRVVTKASAEAFAAKYPLLAESENMKVYEIEERKADPMAFPYVYFLDPGEEYPDCFRFESLNGPEEPGYGTDFDANICFMAEDTQIVPVLPGNSGK